MDTQVSLLSNLAKLSEEDLNSLLSVSIEEKIAVASKLVQYHYPQVETGSEEFGKLIIAYKGSWTLEKVYRNNQYLREGFLLVYTKTGIIRELVNDLYFDTKSLVTH